MTPTQEKEVVKLIQNTKLDHFEIAEKLGVEEQEVYNINKSMDDEETINFDGCGFCCGVVEQGADYCSQKCKKLHLKESN